MIRRVDQKVQLPLPLTRKPRQGSAQVGPAKVLSVAGLFAGIGGIELGLSRVGHETSVLCELDPAATAVLKARFPGVPIHGDITTLDDLPGGTDLVTAGFPCQDLSQAGGTKGIRGVRSGLVGEVFRLLESRPVAHVLLENVPFMLQLSRGRAMEVIVSAFESLGYHWAYRVVDSRAFGLPQRRKRVFFLACLEEDPRSVLMTQEVQEPPEADHESGTHACGFYWTEGIRGLGWAVDAVPTLKGGSTVGIPSPPAIWLPSGEIVKPDIRDAERMQGFKKNWTKPAQRVARPGVRWKLVSNAVSVPVARWIGAKLARPELPLEVPCRVLPKGSPWPLAAWNVGNGRFAAEISTRPVMRKPKLLHEFLKETPLPLSRRATEGFLKRTKRSSLRFPSGFLEAVEAHLAAIEG